MKNGIESGNDEYERRIQEAKACLASAVETNKIGEKLKEEIEGLVLLDEESSNKCKKEKPDAAVDDLTFLDKNMQDDNSSANPGTIHHPGNPFRPTWP